MTDKIVYTVTESGEDGRARTNIAYASFTEKERDDWYQARGRNKNYYSKAKVIAEIENESKKAMGKLDGLQRLVLGLDQRK